MVEGFIHALVAVMAAIVAFQYFVIGFYVIPRLSQLADDPGPTIRAAQWGAMFFFVGCAMTHVGVMVRTITGDVAGYGANLHTVIAHILPHIAQILGGLTFIYIVHRHVDVRFRGKEYAALEHEKDQLLDTLQELATRDHLTGLYNRRAFDGHIDSHRKYVERYGPSGAVVFLDLDGFKKANDDFGHAAGDEVLRRVATVLRRETRTTDVVGRMGGDEFAVLLREASPEDAKRIAERIVRGIAEINEPAPVRASAGVATCLFSGADDVVNAADAAMYEAKRAGGDRFVAVD